MQHGPITQHFTRFSILIGLSALLFLSARQESCKRKFPSDSIVPATVERPVVFLQDQLIQNAMADIKTVSARAKIYAEGDGMAVEAVANLIWIRDSVLWLNIKKLGIEAARALITRDSFFIINRIDRTYQIGEISALQREYGLPDGFPLLQQTVLASAWMAPNIALKSDIRDSLHRLSGSNHQLAVDYRLEEGSFVLRQSSFIQQRESRMLYLQFGGFEKMSRGRVFPYIRRIEAFSPETGALRLDLVLSEVEFNVPKPYRFEIPSHYQLLEE